jgi:uncharacterized membrane protein
MNKTKEIVNKMKVDALYEKKKHFNAADRKRRYHNWIGVSIIVLATLEAFLINQGFGNNGITVLSFVALLIALLGSIQTFFNFQKLAEGHEYVARKFLAFSKESKLLMANADDGLLTNDVMIVSTNKLREKLEDINREASHYPTNGRDYNVAQKGFGSGEEEYTSNELKS